MSRRTQAPKRELLPDPKHGSQKLTKFINMIMKDGKKVWEFGETLRAAQAAFCDKDPAASLVTSTDNYCYSDPWHYDTAGYLDLGEKFAEAMDELRK